jgi:hypothetical protein
MVTKTLSRRLERLEGRFGVGHPPLEIQVSYVEPNGEILDAYVVRVGRQKSDEDNPQTPSQA